MKPTAHYGSIVVAPKVGQMAVLVGAYGHHRIGTDDKKTYWTSEVVNVGTGGEFETLNTIYRKYEEPDELAG